jgi:hypothetical protein
MPSEIVSHIGVTRHPIHIEWVFFNPVFDLVEFHVHGFGALLLDCFIDDAIHGGVVSCVILFVAHFIKGCARDSAFFSIDKDGTKFSISH